jgi:ATP-dependent Clp protease ATP-binding subunit ClpC
MTNFNFILERLSSRAKNALIAAQMISEELKCDHIGTEHLLLGLIREGEGVASQVFMNMGLDLEKVREEVIKLLGSTTPGAQFGPPPASGGGGGQRVPKRGGHVGFIGNYGDRRIFLCEKIYL